MLFVCAIICSSIKAIADFLAVDKPSVLTGHFNLPYFKKRDAPRAGALLEGFLSQSRLVNLISDIPMGKPCSTSCLPMTHSHDRRLNWRQSFNKRPCQHFVSYQCWGAGIGFSRPPKFSQMQLGSWWPHDIDIRLEDMDVWESWCRRNVFTIPHLHRLCCQFLCPFDKSIKTCGFQ